MPNLDPVNEPITKVWNAIEKVEELELDLKAACLCIQPRSWRAQFDLRYWASGVDYRLTPAEKWMLNPAELQPLQQRQVRRLSGEMLPYVRPMGTIRLRSMESHAVSFAQLNDTTLIYMENCLTCRRMLRMGGVSF